MNFHAGSWLFGIEGDLQLSDIDADFGPTTSGTLTADGSADVDFFATARLRAGWAIDRLLIYGTGGLAWVDLNYNVDATNLAGDTVSMSDDSGEWGYAIGGGAEFAFSDAWSMKAEYLFIGLGSEDVTNNVRDAGGVLTGETATTVMTPSFHTVRIGVNWHF